MVGGSFFCVFLALCFCPPSCSFSFSLFCFGFSSLSAGGGACNNPTFQAQNNSKFLFFLYLTHIVLVIGEHVPSHHQDTIHIPTTINISLKS